MYSWGFCPEMVELFGQTNESVGRSSSKKWPVLLNPQFDPLAIKKLEGPPEFASSS